MIRANISGKGEEYLMLKNGLERQDNYNYFNMNNEEFCAIMYINIFS